MLVVNYDYPDVCIQTDEVAAFWLDQYFHWWKGWQCDLVVLFNSGVMIRYNKDATKLYYNLLEVGWNFIDSPIVCWDDVENQDE